MCVCLLVFLLPASFTRISKDPWAGILRARRNTDREPSKSLLFKKKKIQHRVTSTFVREVSLHVQSTIMYYTCIYICIYVYYFFNKLGSHRSCYYCLFSRTSCRNNIIGSSSWPTVQPSRAARNRPKTAAQYGSHLTPSPSSVRSPAAHAIPPARVHAFYALVHLLAVALKVES